MVVIYTDDSGNTGPELLDANQPFGATAFVLLDPSAEERVRAAIPVLLENLAQRPKELKFSGLAKRKSGASFIASLMRLISESGAQLYFSLTEKRYLAATIIVEAFLDPICNDDVPHVLLTREVRTLAANLVASVSNDALLRDFMSSFATRDAYGMRSAVASIGPRLRLHPSHHAPDIAAIFERACTNPCVAPSTPEDPPLSLRPTAHTFTFISILSHIDQCLQKRDLQARIVADMDLQFGDVLNLAFDLARSERSFPNPYSCHIQQITHVVNRTSADSSQVLGLQLADICAGLLAGMARARGLPLEQPALDEAWSTTKAHLLGHAPAGWYQVSEHAIRELQPTFGRLLPLLERDSYDW
jgi:hypothetical protein